MEKSKPSFPREWLEQEILRIVSEPGPTERTADDVTARVQSIISLNIRQTLREMVLDGKLDLTLNWGLAKPVKKEPQT